MAQFYASDFIWNGTPSSDYGLKIVNFDSGGIYNGVGATNIEIYDQRVFRKSKPYFLGRTQSPVLEFKLTFGSEQYLSGNDRNLLSAWLFGAQNYQKLQICQDDLSDVYWNCFLTNPVSKYVGNLNFGFEANVLCDSPFAYNFPRTVSASFSGSAIADYDFTFYNTSADADYMYPTIEFTTSAIGTSFALTNQDDENRIFSFSDIQANETITVNNDLQTIVSDTGLLRVSKFNKNWLRFGRGINRINIVGAITNFTITYQNKVKVGG